MQTALLQKSCLGQVVRPTLRSNNPLRAPHVRTNAKAGNWLPGSETPSYLEDLPASYGFDPLGLGKTDSSLERFTEAELMNGRWAMLGIAGALGAEVLGFGDWYNAPLWAVNGGSPTWFGVQVPFSLETLLAIEFVAMAGAESLRGAQEDPEKRKYPGGPFDPAGLAKGDSTTAKLKELKNGRLAMVAFIGIVAQHAANGLTPIEALKAHLPSPTTANFATNGVSLPF
eukprot:CAMPEP_0206135618 /NCGR_PEP_ID=MMETSP1473-20131121/889_1 /ASSEMBLY_ACC=CAM_ASM_001109 /TAXON_ID=1461547 /ORGANISM="Stichococcus sp, Strain RCC1054" /LENGTH=227 /DNA_ID=CAMNT_0053527593 /DNA_START=97 /DNA_END=780 /DNA_ORIENTATION=+